MCCLHSSRSAAVKLPDWIAWYLGYTSQPKAFLVLIGQLKLLAPPRVTPTLTNGK